MTSITALGNDKYFKVDEDFNVEDKYKSSECINIQSSLLTINGSWHCNSSDICRINKQLNIPDQVKYILRNFNDFSAKDALQQIDYLANFISSYCSDEMKPKIESFILRQVERFNDFSEKEKVGVVNCVVAYIRRYCSEDVSLKLSQLIRKSLLASHKSCCELSAILELILFGDDASCSQSSYVYTAGPSAADILAREVMLIYGKSSCLHKFRIIDEIYELTIAKMRDPSSLGTSFISNLLSSHCKDVAANIKIWALKNLYLCSSLQSWTPPNPAWEMKHEMLLVLGDMLNYGRFAKDICKVIQLYISIILSENRSSNENISIYTSIYMTDAHLISSIDVNFFKNHSSYLGIASLAINYDKLYVIFLLDHSAFAKTDELLYLIENIIINKKEATYLVDIVKRLLTLNPVDVPSTLSKNTIDWISKNKDTSDLLIPILRLLDMHNVDYAAAMNIIVETSDCINFNYFPFIPGKILRLALLKIKCIDHDPSALRKLMGLLLNNGDVDMWEQVSVLTKTMQPKTIVLFLALLNEDLAHGNPEAVSSGIHVIQKMAKSCLQTSAFGKSDRVIAESTIHGLKMLSAKMNALNSFHVGNLKNKRSRVEDI